MGTTQNRAKSVLVVDDDAELANLMKFILEAEGFGAVIAREGNEALGLVNRRMPDLVILDLKMPGMDGWEFLREFHARHD